jgi:hypothetical protein
MRPHYAIKPLRGNGGDYSFNVCTVIGIPSNQDHPYTDIHGTSRGEQPKTQKSGEESAKFEGGEGKLYREKG